MEQPRTRQSPTCGESNTPPTHYRIRADHYSAVIFRRGMGIERSFGKFATRNFHVGLVYGQRWRVVETTFQ